MDSVATVKKMADKLNLTIITELNQYNLLDIQPFISILIAYLVLNDPIVDPWWNLLPTT